MRKIVAVVFFMLVIFSFYKYKQGRPMPMPEQKKVEQSESTSEVTPKPEISGAQAQQEPEKDIFTIHDNDLLLGNRDSKVLIIEYSALTCPHCAYYHKDVYPELKKKYIDTGKVAYVVREFVSNKQDLDGAILSRCLADPKDPVKLLNILYEKQNNWAFNKNYKELLENIGLLAGISKEEYAKCLARDDWVQMMSNNSRAMTFYKEFVGTPAFAINGKIYKGNYDVANLSTAIDAALDEVERGGKVVEK